MHRRFKTLILQAENGVLRLKDEFGTFAVDLGDMVRISDVPPYGMAFDRVEFRRALIEVLEVFKPDVVIFDPWNSIARDDAARDYREAFDVLRRAAES